MLEAGRLLGAPPTARELAARPRLAADDEPYRPRRLPRYSAARREAGLAWVSPKAWPTVDDMQRHFDRYDDLLTGFGAQIARDQSIETFDLIGDHSDDSLQHFRRHYSSWTAGGAPAPRHTRAAQMQREWEEIWAQRRAEQQAESDRQWREAEAKRQAESDRQQREAEVKARRAEEVERYRPLREGVERLDTTPVQGWRVEVFHEVAELRVRTREMTASTHYFRCLLCDRAFASDTSLGTPVLITGNVRQPRNAVIERLCDGCAVNRVNLAGRIAAKLSLCLRMVAA
jgi:hypothetical protein